MTVHIITKNGDVIKCFQDVRVAQSYMEDYSEENLDMTSIHVE